VSLEQSGVPGPAGIGFFVENPKGDLSNFCDFQEKHKGGQKHHFALEFFCFLFCFKTKKKSPKAKNKITNGIANFLFFSTLSWHKRNKKSRLYLFLFAWGKIILACKPATFWVIFSSFFCLDTKERKGQGCIYSFLLGGKIIFACKPATFWVIFSSFFCLDTKETKGQGCIYSFLLGGKIIFACKPATFWAISCGTSQMVPAVYFTKITG